MLKKLKDKKGETLVESLVAMLIALLSMVMLTSCTTAAANINAATRAMDKKFAEELERAEGMMAEAGYETKNIKVKLTFDTCGVQTADVTLYGGDAGTFVTYEYDAGGSGS